jgi:hypothetical protein
VQGLPQTVGLLFALTVENPVPVKVIGAPPIIDDYVVVPAEKVTLD